MMLTKATEGACHISTSNSWRPRVLVIGLSRALPFRWIGLYLPQLSRSDSSLRLSVAKLGLTSPK